MGRESSSPEDISVEDVSEELRLRALETIENAGQGHVGGSSSTTELMTSLYLEQLDFDLDNPDHQDRDRVLVRGHVGPLRYNLFSELGWVEGDELDTYRQYPTSLKGHESHEDVDGVDISPSGSLGMLLSYGVGSQIAAEGLNQDFTTYVFLGDGEEQEGNISEAARHAANLDQDNLVAVLDQNQKQLSRPTDEVDGTDISELWNAYGWSVNELEDGHDPKEISEALGQAGNEDGPSMVIAPTIKGKGVPGNDENPTGHHTTGTAEWSQINQALSNLEGANDEEMHKYVLEKAGGLPIDSETEIPELEGAIDIDVPDNVDRNPDYGQKSYFQALNKIAGETDVNFYFVHSDWVRKDIADMADLGDNIDVIDTGIREQHASSLAHGLSVTDPSARVIVNIGDFLTYRSADQIHASALGNSNVTFLSDTAGFTQDRNGKTHQSAGQPGMFASMPGIEMYETGDVKDLFQVLNKTLTENDGADYIRTHSRNSDMLPREYTSSSELNHYVTLEPGNEADTVLIGSGLTAPEMTKAGEQIATETDADPRVVNIVNHSLDDEFSEYFEDDMDVMVAYNGNDDFLTNNVARKLMENNLSPSKLVGHGFEVGDTGTLDQLLEAYKLDSEGLRQVYEEELK